MAEKKMLFIYNPKAGKAQIRSNLIDIIDVFVKGGYEVTVYPTQGPEDAIQATENRKPGYDILVCCGGDGTLDEVVTGMIGSGELLPIGYVPAGSTNDFANSLDLPKNMVRAAETVVNGEDFACDVGAFNDDIFVYIAAFGLFTDVSYGTGQEMKNLLGHMAYILEGIKRLSSIKSYCVKVSYDDTVIEGDFIYGMITNSISVGGFKRITGKYVELNDGEFEVMLIKCPTNPIELNEIVTALLSKDMENGSIYCFKTSALKVEATEPVAWTLDGEYGGIHKDVTIQNRQQAIQIRVNERKS